MLGQAIRKGCLTNKPGRAPPTSRSVRRQGRKPMSGATTTALAHRGLSSWSALPDGDREMWPAHPGPRRIYRRPTVFFASGPPREPPIRGHQPATRALIKGKDSREACGRNRPQKFAYGETATGASWFNLVPTCSKRTVWHMLPPVIATCSCSTQPDCRPYFPAADFTGLTRVPSLASAGRSTASRVPGLMPPARATVSPSVEATTTLT
jgi:hypothetical protein